MADMADIEKSKAEAAAVAKRLQAGDARAASTAKPALAELMESAEGAGPAPPAEFQTTAQAKERLQEWARKQPGPAARPMERWKTRVVVGLTTLSLCMFAYRMWAQYGHLLQQPTGGVCVQPIMTREHLALFVDGGKGKRLYIGILGEVYDVSKAPQFYGKGNGYDHFTGRDASRAFISGGFQDDLTDEIGDFTDDQKASLVEWKEFYLKEYTYVGRVVGAFFDENGVMTDALREVYQASKRAKAAKAERERNRKLDPACNMRWSQAEGGRVWCDGEMYPRLLTEMVGGKSEQRCACFEQIGWSNVRNVYPGCDPSAHECQTSPPEEVLPEDEAPEDESEPAYELDGDQQDVEPERAEGANEEAAREEL